LRSPALVSRSLNPERHAVLASLSGRYPPLEGRSPTCYSPVRHSTQGRSPFRVRLACVRHAASVDSEPGSNSQVEFLREPLISSSQLLNYLLSCVALQYCRALTLDGLVASTRLGLACVRLRQKTSARQAQLHRVCCTLYLVFKEPRTFGFQARFSPADASSGFLDSAPALFGGTFQAYDDFRCLVNPFFRLPRKLFRRLAWQRCALDQERRVNRVFQM
jgi:hypothetical protein